MRLFSHMLLFTFSCSSLLGSCALGCARSSQKMRDFTHFTKYLILLSDVGKLSLLGLLIYFWKICQEDQEHKTHPAPSWLCWLQLLLNASPAHELSSCISFLSAFQAGNCSSLELLHELCSTVLCREGNICERTRQTGIQHSKITESKQM